MATAIVVAASRLESFTEPFLEFDEGIYMLMAREVAHGHLPYLTLFDAKPAGFFLLLGGAVRAFGASIYTLRAVALLAVLVTCGGVYAIAQSFSSDRRTIGALAVASYISITATSEGLAANAELILTPFVVWALLPIVRAVANRSKLAPGVALASGVLLGIAVELKLTAAGEAAFAVVFAAFATAGSASAVAALVAGILAPTALIGGLYAAFGVFSTFVDANLLANIRRLHNVPRSATPLYRTLAGELRSFLPATIFVPCAGFAWSTLSIRERKLAPWLGAWLAIDVVQVFFEGELFPHQFIDAMAPAAIVGAWAAVRALKRYAAPHTIRVALGLATAAAFAYHAVPHDLAALHQLRGSDVDDRDRVAAFLAPNLGRRSLFVVDDHQLYYVLEDRPIPSRIAPFLANAALASIAGSYAPDEINRIFGTTPDVVIRQTQFDDGDAIDSAIEAHLTDYTQVFCAGKHCVYERKAP